MRTRSVDSNYRKAIHSFTKSLNFKGSDSAYMNAFLGDMVQSALRDGSLTPPKEKSTISRLTLLTTAAAIMTQFMTEEAIAATAVEVTGQVVHVYTVDKAPHQYISITTQPAYGRVEVDQQKGTITYYPDENHQADVYEFELSDDSGFLLFFGLGLLGLGGGFALTSGGDGKDMKPQPDLDFGDAPTGISPVSGIVFSFPTLLADNGARHVITPGVFIGNTPPDQEGDGQPNFLALGDDNAGIDDEDSDFDSGQFIGVPGPNVGEFTLLYKASTPGFISIWIDANADGDWNDSGEWIIQAEAITPAGDGTFTVIADESVINVVIASVEAGNDVFARIRFSTDQSSVMTPYGLAPDGEVEDFLVMVGDNGNGNGNGVETDFGDAPNAPFPTLLENDGARHVIVENMYLGSTPPDAETDGQPDANALGDNNFGTAPADEDTASIQIVDADSDTFVDDLAYSTSSSGFVSLWLDLDNSGTWDLSNSNLQNEYIAIAQSVPGGSFNILDIPIAETDDPMIGRLRFSDDEDAIKEPTGLAPNGEVEDFTLLFVEIDSSGIFDFFVT